MFSARRNLQKVYPAKPRRSEGFTLIEMLVVLVIFSILTGVVLIGQSKFNSSILLTNLAYDTALNIRLAQNYGINIKEFSTSTVPGVFVPYGVHFEKGTNNKSFILFADLDKNGLFDGDISKCETLKGCVNRYSIKRGNNIAALCKAEVPTGQNVCPTTPVDTNISKLDVVFIRPNPDAHMISSVGDTEYTVATIILGGADQQSFRKVVVRSNGLIEVAH